MTIEHKTDGWWITGHPYIPDCGPYTTKQEALDDLAGLRRFLDNEHDRRFFTSEREIDELDK